MQLLTEKDEVRASVAAHRASGLTIGFVPTMGALHAGHISLIRASAAETGCTVVSIFVNPSQFGPNEDYDSYPRDLAGDLALIEQTGAKIVYAPSVDAMYKGGHKTYVNVQGLDRLLCGAHRPGHFRGVATIVAKLLNIVRPDILYLGRKDAQQAIILRRMVRDLDFDVDVRVMPTVREPDGLAMSSRNIYLSKSHRAKAARLFESLRVAGRLFEEGQRDASEIVDAALDFLRAEKEIDVEYLQARDAEDLETVREIGDRTLVLLAARIGGTRLIDNIVLDPGQGSFEP